MTNAYIPIDPSWSFNFLNGIRPHLEKVDCYHFTDHIYNLTAEYVRLTHNFRFTNSPVLCNQSLHAMWMDLERNWDIPVPYYQVAFRQLFNTLLCVSNNIPNEITKVTPVTDDVANLTGLIFTF